MDTDHAHSLFPADVPQGAVPPEQFSSGPIAKPVTMAPQSKPASDPAFASSLFPTEALPDRAAAVASTFEPWAVAAHAGGNAAQAEEWRAAGEVLASDFRDSAMDPEDVRAIMDLTREAQGHTTFGAVDVERLEIDRARAADQLIEAGVTDADVDLARRLVTDLDAKMGGKVSAWLRGTGQGNDPRTIQRAISEAKRRGYR